ncbi:MAG: branched-chain amino acid ABC transporter permease [Erysipelotrichaceae bacterium]|nr:branched-chain amino acid ABC transporter permease [Erysipelotrichaceae bacterium]
MEMKQYNKAPSMMFKKDNIIKQVLRKIINFLKSPIIYFVLMGIVLIVLGNLANKKIIPYSMSKTLATLVVYGIISIGFCLLLGYSGLASLGTAGFVGVGAMVAHIIIEKYPFYLYLGGQAINVSIFIALLGAIIVSIILGMFVGFISLRIEGMYLAILTLGLAEIIFQLLENIASILNGTATIKVSSSNAILWLTKLDNASKCALVTVIFVILLVLTQNLINSPTGRAMVTMKNSTSAAQAMGISLIKYRLLAFVISTVYAAIGGLLYITCVTSSLSTTDDPLLSLNTSLNILGAVIIGGSKSLWGVILGVMILFGIQPLFLNEIEFFEKNPSFMGLVSGILIVVIVMFFPGGLSQLFLELKLKVKRLFKKIKERMYGSY